MKWFVLVLVLAFLVSCAAEVEVVEPELDDTPVDEPAVIDEPEIVVEDDVIVEETEVTEPEDELSEDEQLVEDLITNKAVTVVSCDQDRKRVVIVVKNIGEITWDFSRNIPFPPPTDRAAVKILVNNYDAAKDPPAINIDTNEPYFGDFEESCGTWRLEPGEQMRCDFPDAPLIREGTLRENKVWVSAPEANFPIVFECE